MLPGAAGGMEALPSIGLQGAFGSVNMGIPRQRCRDFEERGYCLRGDMCPMEHGVNRIVIEDVQSLSQFNLPVSLPSVLIVGTQPMSCGLASASSTSALLMNKGSQGKNSKSNGPDAVMISYSTSGNVSASELYDPDQPLWSNGRPEGPPFLPLQSRPADDAELFDHNNMGLQTKEPADAGHQGGGVEFRPASQGTSLSVWGRIGQSKDDKKGEFGHKTNTSGLSGKENGDAIISNARSSHHGKKIAAYESGQKLVGSLYQVQSDIIHTPWKPTQKALCTLFLNGIPQKSNRRDALFAHFKKFGEVIDIRIPSNSERAFVQFCKREEAESALNAPDAVMGNRFIKLWWAKRDNIVDEGMGNLPVTPKSLTGSSVPGNPCCIGRGKDVSSVPLKAGEAAESGHVQASDQSTHIIGNSPKVTPTNQKKLESLEQLKEELRKKQEMLDRKRDEFKRQLDKLERQGKAISDQLTKRQKVGLAGDVAKVSTLTSSDAAVVSVRLSSPSNEVASSQIEVINGAENMASVDLPSEKAATLIEESSSSKEQTQSLSTVVTQSLDNDHPTFQVLPTLATGLTDVAALEKHFTAYGDLTIAKLEDADG
ncbi:hypothetical protein MLD38_000418 [Melastoma candidum]|uniref:Uncharacterized protein n=1 Tax=Melastoma candidum TaxID=119954 RepID=A0ACB9SBZ2_9MYRT|nr:hypothetical protein MLD38_000418 [Melastoma candidum]